MRFNLVDHRDDGDGRVFQEPVKVAQTPMALILSGFS